MFPHQAMNSGRIQNMCITLPSFSAWSLLTALYLPPLHDYHDFPINRRWKRQEVREFLRASSQMENIPWQISDSVRGAYLRCKVQ